MMLASVLRDGARELTEKAFDDMPVVKTSGDGPGAALLLGSAAVFALGMAIIAVDVKYVAGTIILGGAEAPAYTGADIA